VLFLGVGLWLAFVSFYPETPPAIALKVARKLEREFKRLDAEAHQILAAQDTAFSADNVSYPFFLYKQGMLVHWSDNRWPPPSAFWTDSLPVKLVQDANMSYLAKRWGTAQGTTLIGLIPLSHSFKIVNEYLEPEWNTRLFSSSNTRILEPTANLGVPVCIENQCYFRISFLPQEIPTHFRTRLVAVIFLSAALLLLVVMAYSWMPPFLSRFAELELVYLFCIFRMLRYAMVQANFPNMFIHFGLFDPQVFAASSLNASLGDLVLNLLALLVLCYYLFRRYTKFWIFQRLRATRYGYWVLSVFAAVCFLFGFLFPAVTVQTLYNNSSLPLTIVQSLRFDGLMIMGLVAVLLSGVCAFLFIHVFVRVLVGDRSRVRIVVCYAVGAAIFAGINELTGQPYAYTLLAATLYFATVYLLRLYSSLNQFKYATFAYLFAGVIFLCLSAAQATSYYTRQEVIDSQFRFARNFLIDRDYFGEYLLRETWQNVTRDAFIQSRIVSPFLSKDPVRQKIRQVFLPSYFNKYDVEIMLFNATGDGMDNGTEKSFGEYISFYEKEASRTEYSGVYFLNNPQADVTQKYLVVIPIRKMHAMMGHVVIELSLKRIIPENVYPELLVDNRFQEYYRTQELSYAVFASGGIQFTSGNYNYDRLFDQAWLGDPEMYSRGLSRDGYVHIAQEDQNGRVAVVSSADPDAALVFSAFSFLFVLGMAVILLVLSVLGIIRYASGNDLYFSARIQFILNLSFFMPLILVSVTTLSLISNSSQEQLNDEYRNKARAFAQQLSNNPEGENLYDIDDQLTELANLSNLDANLYDTRGRLLVSSQPLIAESGIISGYINSEALSRVRSGDNVFIKREQIGKLSYYVAYAALKSPVSGRLTGILGIPFFQSAYSLERAQITILANILNIFAGIFIVLLVLSYFVSRWLTFPLTFITQSLKRTSLMKTNQPLTWNANDEIGLMAKEYNQMLYKLSESKAELEQTQREKAWREIAQQVAHEIKNPLTPMKLTLQQLERWIQQGTSSPEKTEKAVSALLTQVDTLNDIASSFSTFAKMPDPVMQRTELVQLVRRVVDLHSQSAEVVFTSSVRALHVLADEQVLGRIFSNLIINGIQANRPGTQPRVEVSLKKHGDAVVVRFHDNGKGISPEVAERIFIPHFTTKKSGSGLGLAIARQGIEHMHGRIWFETEEGKGTAFFIELPAL
jgi:two-component system nitrogen regulation sensor histidine kinase NtrY